MLAENGQMAIHLALNAARIGPFSTNTAHPHVLALMQEILCAALGIGLVIRNPYVEKTKAEVVATVATTMPLAIPVSTSCWKNTRLQAPATHCGACIPCIVRRIAVETHIPDATAYARDCWGTPLEDLEADDELRRNLADYAEFVRRIESESPGEIMRVWPELRSQYFNADPVIAMYKRAAAEARAVLLKYSAVAPLLQ